MNNDSRKSIIQTGSVFHIISEPGDATRYDYFVFRDGDDFCFMPRKSTFRFPQRINYWDIVEETKEIIQDISKRENCNPFTVSECIRTAKSLFSGEEQGGADE